jgi:aspartyl-tRNA(Asn)/glutamyl-tRNA(Gln) amidotransferase subunit C
MSDLSDRDFEHLKKLCRLELTPEEEANMRPSIQNILKHVEKLNEVNTDGVASCNFVLRSMHHNEMREDEIKDLLPRDEFLANAPDKIGGMVRVPAILKHQES